MNKEKIIKENDIIDLREKSEEDVIDAYSKISQKIILLSEKEKLDSNRNNE